MPQQLGQPLPNPMGEGGDKSAVESTASTAINHALPAEERPTIQLVPYLADESQLPAIMRMISADLSEPYCIYTYRYFIHHWPELCLLAQDKEKGEKSGDDGRLIGVIICKMDRVANTGYCTGYIAMLAVEPNYRRMGIGSTLVQRAMEVMEQRGCDEVMLETEVTNAKALNLYSRLGFIRDRRLFRYYLNGVDAFRLKLYLSENRPSVDYIMSASSQLDSVKQQTEEEEVRVSRPNEANCKIEEPVC